MYWDTNGTDWKQSFGRVTANLHVTEDIYKNMDTKAWCYVGKYGENNQNRCQITPTNDGFNFVTNDLSAYENLTFAIDFKPDTFNVLIEKNYTLVILLLIEIAIAAFFLIKKYLKCLIYQ